MKKFTSKSVLAITLVAAMSFSMAACMSAGKTDEPTVPDDTTAVTEIQTESTEEKMDETTEAAVQETQADEKTETESTAPSDTAVTEETEEQIAFEDVNEIVYAQDDVNIREEPSTDGKSLGHLLWGEAIIRTGKGDNGWSRVQYKDGEAYIHSNYLSKKAPEPDPVPTDESGRSLPTLPAATDPEHSHVYADTIIKPTCTEEGYTKHYCSCGLYDKSDVVPALGHSFGEWTVLRDPTVTTKGERTRTCRVCSFVDVEYTEKLVDASAGRQ